MYYVYELVDPRDERPFYVGKGSGDRVKEHAKEARKGRVSPKCDRIREIWAVGLEIASRIVREFDDEARAYSFERRHINKLGLENLTNIAPGGGAARKHVERAAPKLSPFEAKASMLWIWANKQPRKGMLSQALWRALERAVPRIFEELLSEFGRETVVRRLMDEYRLKISFVENNA